MLEKYNTFYFELETDESSMEHSQLLWSKCFFNKRIPVAPHCFHCELASTPTLFTGAGWHVDQQGFAWRPMQPEGPRLPDIHSVPLLRTPPPPLALGVTHRGPQEAEAGPEDRQVPRDVAGQELGSGEAVVECV